MAHGRGMRRKHVGNNMTYAKYSQYSRDASPFDLIKRKAHYEKIVARRMKRNEKRQRAETVITYLLRLLSLHNEKFLN